MEGRKAASHGEESNTMDTSLKCRRYAFRPRLSLADFVNEPDAYEAALDDRNPHPEKKISNMRDLLPILEQRCQQGRPC